MIRPLLLAPLLMVAACDSTAPGSGGPEAAGNGAGGAAGRSEVVLGLLPSDRGGMTAAASGTLAVRGRCLVLEAGGEALSLAFATADTRWDSSAGVLRVGGRSFAPGSRVELGGGNFSGNGDTLPWIRRPPAECGSRFWIVSSIENG